MSVVTLFVSGSTTSVRAERRFNKNDTIATIKQKLELVVGIPATSMCLKLQDSDNNTICTLDGDDTMLGAFPVQDMLQLYVENTDPMAVAGEFEDVTKVKKFELSEEEYESRRGTVREFKEKLKLGRFNPEFEQQRQLAQEQEEELAKSTQVGQRCECDTKKGTHRGTVRFVGKTEFQDGLWIGVQLDEPYGNNDGSVKGVQYFSCSPKYGVFLKPSNVRVGNYPEEDMGLSSEDEFAIPPKIEPTTVPAIRIACDCESKAWAQTLPF
eukprot:gene5206-8809_t